MRKKNILVKSLCFIAVYFLRIFLFNGDILKIYLPTFLMIFVLTIPITEIKEKVGHIVLSLVSLKSL